MVRTLTTFHHVRTAGFQTEVHAPILQREPAAFGHDSSTEFHEVAINERASVPVLVHDRKANGVTVRTD